MILKKLLVVALSAVLCILEVGCSSKNTSSGEKKDEIVYASTKDMKRYKPTSLCQVRWQLKYEYLSHL